MLPFAFAFFPEVTKGSVEGFSDYFIPFSFPISSILFLYPIGRLFDHFAI